MKKITTFISAMLLVFISVSQTKTAPKKTAVKKNIAVPEMVVTYKSTGISDMGMALYTFTNTKGKSVDFMYLDEKNPGLKVLFESGSMENATEGDFTVKDNAGKKYKVTYKIKKANGEGTWDQLTILTAEEVK